MNKEQGIRPKKEASQKTLRDFYEIHRQIDRLSNSFREFWGKSKAEIFDEFMKDKSDAEKEAFAEHIYLAFMAGWYSKEEVTELDNKKTGEYQCL